MGIHRILLPIKFSMTWERSYSLSAVQLYYLHSGFAFQFAVVSSSNSNPIPLAIKNIGKYLATATLVASCRHVTNLLSFCLNVTFWSHLPFHGWLWTHDTTHSDWIFLKIDPFDDRPLHRMTWKLAAIPFVQSFFQMQCNASQLTNGNNFIVLSMLDILPTICKVGQGVN